MKKLLQILCLLLPSLVFGQQRVELVPALPDAICGTSFCPGNEYFESGEDLPTLAECEYFITELRKVQPDGVIKCRIELYARLVGEPDQPRTEPDPEPETPTDPIPGEPSAYRGIPDPSASLGFDVFADYPSNRTLAVSSSRHVAECTGTAADPCVYDASGQTMQKLVLAGSYIVVKGGQINYPPVSGPAVNAESCEYCVLVDVIVSGPGVDSSHSAAVGLGDNVVWLRGKIHGFGDNRKEAREQDFHGIKTGGNGPTWILEAEIYDNSGDSVQVGDASRGASNNVFIGGGYFHDNRENGVDIKDSRNVVVSGVRLSGFSPTSSDPGAAIVIHDDAFNALIYDNIITDTNTGIVTSGVSGHKITGNDITATRTGIECRNTGGLTILDNAITAPLRIDVQSNCNGEIQD